MTPRLCSGQVVINVIDGPSFQANMQIPEAHAIPSLPLSFHLLLCKCAALQKINDNCVIMSVGLATQK